VEEMKNECKKMNEEVEYFKNLAKTSKLHSEKALNDIDFYKNLLKKHNIIT